MGRATGAPSELCDFVLSTLFSSAGESECRGERRIQVPDTPWDRHVCLHSPLAEKVKNKNTHTTYIYHTTYHTMEGLGVPSHGTLAVLLFLSDAQKASLLFHGPKHQAGRNPEENMAGRGSRNRSWGMDETLRIRALKQIGFGSGRTPAKRSGPTPAMESPRILRDGNRWNFMSGNRAWDWNCPPPMNPI